jgi:hypothetical protein
MRNMLIHSLPKKVIMTPYQLATDLLKGKITDLAFDAHMVQMFPDFVGFYTSEKVELAVDFIKTYLPDCKATIDFNKKEVTIIRDERLAGVAKPYKNKIATVSFQGRPLAQALVAAGLYAYHYLFS